MTVMVTTRVLQAPQRSYMTLILILIVFLSVITGITAVCPADTPNYKRSDALLRFSNNDASGHPNVQVKAVEESVAKLSALKGSIAVVVVTGPARTGRSYLMNQLLANNDETGGVRHSVQTQTRDVDMQVIPGCALSEFGLKDSELTVIFLVTPGLYTTDRPLKFDSQVFALLQLISSIVVYNTNDILMNTALQQLGGTIDTAFALSYMATTDDNSKRLDRPHFVWVQQHAALQLKDGDGNAITPKQFIEQVLEEMDDASNTTTQYAERFHKFFESVDGTLLRHSTELTEKEYRSSITDLRTQLMGKLQAKKLDNEKINGQVLATLITEWIRTMESPELNSQTHDPRVLLNNIVEAEVEKAKSQYVRIMESKYSADKLPQDEYDLEKDHRNAVRDISRGKEGFGMTDYIRKFMEITDALYKRYVDDNMFQLHIRAQTNVRSKFAPWWEQYEKELDSMSVPFSEEDFNILDAKMEEMWNSIEESLSQFERDSQQISIRRYKQEWTAWYLQGKKQKNDIIAAKQCENRAKTVAAYYNNVSWFSATQSAVDFDTMMDLLQRPLIKSQRESIINELRPLLPSPLLPLLNSTGPLVCMTRGGAHSPPVLATYDNARESFNIGFNIRLVIATILTLSAYAVLLSILCRIPMYYFYDTSV